MVTQELIEYVKVIRGQSVNDQIIRGELVSNGWSLPDINQVLQESMIPLEPVIPVKVKSQNKIVYISLGIALLVLLIGGSVFGGSKIKQALYSKYPEMVYIPEELKSDFPRAQITVNVGFSKDFGTNKSTSTITVGIMGKESLAASDRKRIGVKVCDLLKQNSTSYDIVAIQQIQRSGFALFHFDKTLGEGATCEEWRGVN